MEGGLTLYVDTNTKYTTLKHSIRIDYEDYDNFPKLDKWMAPANTPATAFFRL